MTFAYDFWKEATFWPLIYGCCFLPVGLMSKEGCRATDVFSLFFLVAGVVLPLLVICQNEFLLMSTKANTTDISSKSRSSLEAAFAGNKNFSTQSVVGW